MGWSLKIFVSRIRASQAMRGDRQRHLVPGTHRGAVLLGAVLLLVTRPIQADPVVLVQDGVSRCVVVTPLRIDGHLKVAVDDLIRCLQAMSGAKVDVVCDGTTLPNNLRPIRIGIDIDDPLLKKAKTDQAFVRRVAMDRIVVCGPSATAPGTMFGIYDFLESLGVRWFMPGELGEVIPKSNTVALAMMEKLEQPDFVGRRIQYSSHYKSPQQTPLWERRVKLSPSVGIPGSHAFHKWMPANEYFKNNPQYYSLINGQRTPPQLCTSNPEVVRIFCENIIASLRRRPRGVVPIGPSDGTGFCECNSCRALDSGDLDPHYNRISVTDRLMVFFNQVAVRVGKEFPNTRFSFYIYVTHRRPPLKVEPHPKLIGMIAPIRLCVIHGPDRSQCPQRSVEWVGLVRQWTSLPLEVWNRDYGSVLYGGACFPLNLSHRWRAEIPLCKQLGIKGFRVETWVSWAGQMLDPYLMAKLWWKADTDVNALAENYFAAFFGPAAEPMQRYWKRIGQATADSPYHAISLSSLNLRDWYPPHLVEAGSGDLEHAAALVRTSKQEQRVNLFRKAHDALDHYLRMIDQMENGQFGQAAESYQIAHEIASAMCAGDPPLLDPYAFVHLYQDWDQSCHTWNDVPHYSALAAQRVTDGHELVTMLPPIWLTQIDPKDLGQTQQWYRTDILSPLDWIQRSTHTSARNQGLGGYHGPIWYRCVVLVPKRFKDRTIKLYFAGLRRASVWVNGRIMGKVPVIQPREVDVSQGIVAGQENHIVVRCPNTHGIYRPAFLWSPMKSP